MGCDTRKPGVGQLVLDLVCVMLGMPGVGKLVLYIVWGDTREAWCKEISLRSSVCNARGAWCKNK